VVDCISQHGAKKHYCFLKSIKLPATWGFGFIALMCKTTDQMRMKMRNPDIVFGNEHWTGATMDDNGGMHSGKLADVGQLTDSVVVFCPPASKQLNCLGRQDTATPNFVSFWAIFKSTWRIATAAIIADNRRHSPR